MCLWDTLQARASSLVTRTGTTTAINQTITIDANNERSKLLILAPSAGTIRVSLVSRANVETPIGLLSSATPSFLVLDLKLHSKAICDSVKLLVSDAAAVWRVDEEILPAKAQTIKDFVKWIEIH